jgi:hypothetical protein
MNEYYETEYRPLEWLPSKEWLEYVRELLTVTLLVLAFPVLVSVMFRNPLALVKLAR